VCYGYFKPPLARFSSKIVCACPSSRMICEELPINAATRALHHSTTINLFSLFWLLIGFNPIFKMLQRCLQAINRVRWDLMRISAKSRHAGRYLRLERSTFSVSAKWPYRMDKIKDPWPERETLAPALSVLEAFLLALERET
jgi:hypothetical protein